ncbi:TonB-dependent receptor [Algibacter mikhailovii]|uniref:TonB-dependent receptor n=1 Tax=Algibacter mikhailovii TaxID=425498 RepID=UPI002494BC79|nr:carboxypeptidase-like regulatory domain-containing protein [Algibacter mikhailovii]
MRFLSIILFCSIASNAQNMDGIIKGEVSDDTGQPLLDTTIILNNTAKGTSTDIDGLYTINKILPGDYILKVSAIGFKTQEINVSIVSGKTVTKNVVLLENTSLLNEVVVTGKTKAAKIEEVGFSVDAIETQKIRNQSIELNAVLNKAPGINVRSTGGIGSDFEYSINGLTGNAIRFFIDGIPMDYYGSSYSINNLPISLIERIDIYKGVVPVNLGSDALGGAINLVTNQKTTNFASASYSFGSFNTHQVALHGQWKSNSGFTTRLSTFYTYSDNNYKVWGQGVFYGEEGTGKAIEFTKDNPAERFNDDFKTASAKFDIGFSQKKWADQCFISLLVSGQKKGIQTGQTMGHIYGEMRNNEEVIMPSLTYQKKDFLTKGLDVNTFAGYSHTKSVVIDTTKNVYDWRGEIIGTNPSGGEIGRNGSSLYTQIDKSEIFRINGTYELPANFKIGVNYLYSNTRRTGDDPFAAASRIPYSQPQGIGSHFAGLSLETKKFNNKLYANAFFKYYGFNASINDLVYTTEYEIINYNNHVSNFGGGFAASYKILPNLILKSSLEQATRLPSPTEALGDGVTIQPNFEIEPEQSFNVNVGAILGRYALGNHGVKIALNAFYRNVTDKLQLNIFGGQELGQYTNIRKIGGTGAEIDIVYDYNQNLRFNLNGTYQDIRNKQKIDENGNNNILYGDRLRNQPYLLANAGVEYTINDFIQKKSKIFTYLQSSYVHEFFLRWPSLGTADQKDIVPTQLVFDAGASYTFPSKKISVAIDISNILNEQVYDNFLLQKPGRAIFAKINYQL